MVVVHKFGGTNFPAGGSGHLLAASIIEDDLRERDGETGLKQVIVVSALADTTDALLKLANKAVTGIPLYSEGIQSLTEVHLTLADLLLGQNEVECKAYKARLQADEEEMLDLLHALYITRKLTTASQDLLLAYGEVWSTLLMFAYLRTRLPGVAFLDARDVLCVDNAGNEMAVNWRVTRDSTRAFMKRLPESIETVVVTGFIARTTDNVTMTLDRKGSDFTASIFGHLLGASEITIWTNFDGIFSADPSIVDGARLISEVSYNEALEFSFYSNSAVVHPKTMLPAIHDNIPIRIRSSSNRSCAGTKIHGEKPISPGVLAQDAVKGFAHRRDLALITIQGAPVTPGDSTPLQERHTLLMTLREANVAILVVLHAAAENTLTLCVPENAHDRALAISQAHYKTHLQMGAILSITPQLGYAVLTAIGDHIADVPGVAARFFTGVERARINVHGIAQNGERLVSVIVRNSDLVKALRAVHASLSFDPRTISVAVICGRGSASKRLATAAIERIMSYRAHPRPNGPLLELLALAYNGKMRLVTRTDASAMRLDNMDDTCPHVDLDKLALHTLIQSGYRAVIIDCSQQRDTALLYARWLESGVHVITANTIGVAGLGADLDALVSERLGEDGSLRARILLEEAISNAGTPLVETIDSIMCTDQLVRFEAGLSPIAMAACDLLTEGKSLTNVFELLLRQYHENDVRDALAGQELVRKAAIVARLARVQTTEEQGLVVDRLCPFELSLHDDAFRAHALDIEARFASAAAQGESLRYVAIITPEQGIRVELSAVKKSHAFARTCGPSVAVSVVTSRSPVPVVITSQTEVPCVNEDAPDAQSGVTKTLAANLMGDLFRLANMVLSDL